MGTHGDNRSEHERDTSSETEQALRESERRYRELVSQVTDYAIFRTDPEGRPVTWNEGVQRLLGFDEEEFIGADIKSLIFTPEAIEAGIPDREFEEAARTGTANNDRWMRRKSGEHFYAEGVTNAIRDARQNLVGFTKIMRDRTDLMHAEEALRESEERYRTLFDSMDEAYAVVEVLRDESGRWHDFLFIEVNPAFVKHTAMEYPVGRTATDLLGAPNPRWAEIYGQVAETGEPVRIEEQEPTLGRIFDLYIFRLGGPGSRRVAVLFTNITHRKQAEAALKELNETLELRVAERTAEVQRKSEQLRALASQLSQTELRERKRLAKILHDHIQQLIVAARMQLEWMKRDDDLERLRATAQGVYATLDEAQQAARSLAVELSPPVLHETGLIGGLNWLAARMQERQQFSVRLRADSSAEPANEETRFLLFECVRELLLNAVKHAGVRDAEVTLMRRGDERIEIVVLDRGKGFDPDVVKKRRADEVSFGLFSIQERLAHLGGSMHIESAPGRGTQVTLVVPLAKAEPAAVTSVEPAEQSTEKTVRILRKPESCRLLIVDDHQIMREGLAGLFEFESDIEVVGQAGDGPEAIRLAAKLKPDMVLMDVNLGEMDGVEATRRILANDPEIQVIGLSMHSDEGIANDMRNAGAAAYLTKGGPSDDLIEAIRMCFNR